MDHSEEYLFLINITCPLEASEDNWGPDIKLPETTTEQKKKSQNWWTETQKWTKRAKQAIGSDVVIMQEVVMRHSCRMKKWS